MDDNITISVVIVTWNNANTIEKTIDSLLAQTIKPNEIIIIDNGSSDNTLQHLEKFKNYIQLTELGYNSGFCYANNLGISLTQGNYVLISNPDVVYNEHYIEYAINFMKDFPKVGIIGGKLPRGDIDPKTNKRYIDSAGIFLGRNLRTYDRGAGTPDTGMYEKTCKALSVCAAAMLCRKDCLNNVRYGDKEYFDEMFFAYKEDIDIGWRAINSGWDVVYLPSAIAIHERGWKHGSSRSSIDKNKRYHSFKNRYIMLLKNLTLKDFCKNFPLFIIFEIAFFIYIVLREPFLLKSYWYIISNLKKIISHRNAKVSLGKYFDGGNIYA